MFFVASTYKKFLLVGALKLSGRSKINKELLNEA
jgi:hypothetical protein